MGLVDRVRAVLGMAPRRATFSESAPRPIDDMLRDLYDGLGKVTRADALSVPAVKRGRDVICSVATLPLETVDARRRPVGVPLLEQIDPNTTNVVVLSMLLEDLLFESVSYWLVTQRDGDGFPVKARHVDVGAVSTQPPEGVTSKWPMPSGIDPRELIWVEGRLVSKRDVKRFDSPNTPLLRDGHRAIKRAVALDKAAELFAENPRAQDFFTPADPNVDPGSDDEINAALDKWAFWRRKRVTGYVPAALTYNQVQQPTPVDLQLVQLQERAALDIAIAIGLSPEDVGVSTTSRTYANVVDARQDRINDVLSPYMAAVTQRLSMGDITRPGHKVRFDLDDYLRADPKTRSEVQLAYLAQGVIVVEDIREQERLPVMDTPPAPRPVIQATVGRPLPVLEAHAVPAARFTRQTGVTFDAALDATFAVDVEARIITGLAVPYGKVARYKGRRYRFARGALEWVAESRVKLLRDHLPASAIGKAISLVETAAGLVATFKVSPGAAGDEALALAADQVLDGLSIGVEFSLADLRPDPLFPGALLVLKAALAEVSLTAMPAFEDSRLTSVRASQDGGNMTCATCGTIHADGVVACPTPAPPAVVPPAPVPLQFTADQVAWMQANGVGVQPPPPVPPAVPAYVDPAAGGPAVVVEPASYRFTRDGNLAPAAHDFGMDMIAAAKDKDPAAGQRVMEFVRAQFDVATGDINELNPTINLPRYIDQREFKSPVWDVINKGAPPNGVQPFSWPKFNTAAGLVGAHTEGTEPTSGSYTTTSQTVTPTAVSGKAKITRETWDMGGMPGIGNLIWRQMMRGWFEALEARAIAALDAVTPTAIALTAGGGTTGQTLAAELRAAFANLHYVRGGFSMTDGFAQVDFYRALTGALDDTGRPLFPAIGPTNADGTVSNRYASINVNGVPFLPAWALAATGSVVASSYLFDRLAVDGWATAPQQLTMPEIEVAHVYLGIWGYGATAVNDLAGVREITYDPVP